MNEPILSDEEIARALRTLTPSREAFERGVVARVADSRATSAEALREGGRSWMVKAAAWLPMGLLETSTLAKGLGTGAGTAVKGGGAALGFFSVLGAVLGAVATLVTLLTIGLFQVRRTQQRPERPAKLSDGMNYAEDKRVIGGIVATIALGVYLLFFEKRELTLLLSAVAVFGSTVFTLMTLDRSGRSTRETVISLFDPFFTQMALFIWLGLMITDGESISSTVSIAPAVFVVGALVLRAQQRPFDLSIFALEAVLSIIMLEFFIGAVLSNDALDVAPDSAPGLGLAFRAISEWAIVIASVASVSLVVIALKDASEDIFAGPKA